MTPENCKIVTEYIGECWHEVEYEGDSFCRYCGEHYTSIQNRTFTTWNDFGAVFEKLVEKGDWREFHETQYDYWWDDEIHWEKEHKEADFNEWLLSRLPDGTYRLCQLVADALREGVIG